MLDTTCASSPRLHYARANFRYNFEIVKIESQTTPALAYQAPGAFGETGDQRQYSFLMYNQPGFRDLTDLKVPGDGQAFDAEKFKSDNGLADPVAGVGMVVKLSGETSCDGQTVPPPSNGGNAPPAAPSAAPPAPSAPPAQGPTSSAGGARPQPTPAPAPAPGSPEPSAAPTSTSAVRQTPAVPSPSPASSPSAAQSTATSQSTGDEEQAASTSAPASSGTSRARPIATITSTVLGDVPSTLVPSAPGAAETASGTVSGPPVVQTDSAASELEVKLAGAVVLGSAVVFAGLLVW
ncbi:uncharacterized protein EI97DRAFT_436490 [Westerdykella ornata]|uniref:Uncharacterized protein n=1 Tax=Westerdykella ornata TaxID=318751 RepID=A0A6A6JCF9_WESOR|nr:uncharacterized protein EI97DRAFT_436490 [Westerdykella ornata]KAF2272879.1 hypothetical protein EI97DRAFT_436490 [Westerdykella ornata]